MKPRQINIVEQTDGFDEYVDAYIHPPPRDSAGKKRQLLEMAKRGNPRPPRTTLIGGSLGSYICRSSCSYDLDFDEKIRKLRPDWFPTSTIITAAEKKRQLLELAKRGDPKPLYASSLGNALSRYTNPSSSSYDPHFDKEVRKLRPDWFITRSDQAAKKKKQLIEMAKRGDPKPCYESSLGSALSSYISLSSQCYNLDFKMEIKKLRPDWVATQADRVAENKIQLLEMAKRGDPRPATKTSLGVALVTYTGPLSQSLDPDFDKKIRRLRPDWYITQSDQAAKKKNQLIEMAKRGDARPHRKTSLGNSLAGYICPSSKTYDPDFEEKIRKLPSDWFKKLRKPRSW